LISAFSYCPGQRGAFLALQNFGTSTAFLETEEALPTSVWFGISHTVKSMNFGLDVSYIMNNEEKFIPDIGFEYTFGTVPLILATN